AYLDTAKDAAGTNRCLIRRVASSTAPPSATTNNGSSTPPTKSTPPTQSTPPAKTTPVSAPSSSGQMCTLPTCIATYNPIPGGSATNDPVQNPLWLEVPQSPDPGIAFYPDKIFKCYANNAQAQFALCRDWLASPAAPTRPGQAPMRNIYGGAHSLEP